MRVLFRAAPRPVRVELELGKKRAVNDHVAGAAGELEHLARDGRGHVDHGLGGFHRHQVVVEADGVAFLDVPLDDGGIRQAFAEVGEQEFLGGHDVSWGSPGIVIPNEVRDLGCTGAAGKIPRRARNYNKCASYPAAITRFAAAPILSTLGRYFISSRNSGMWVS